MAEAQEYHTIATFEVSIDNVLTSDFVRVSGLGLEVEDIVNKDQKGKHTVNTPGGSNARDLQLTRIFNGDKSLYQWMAEVKEKGSSSKKRTGSIVLKDAEEKAICQFDFDGAWIKQWHGPDLDKNAGANMVLVESCVVSVSDIKMA